jgi:CBS domain containing-hemolysin-like protein
MTVDRRLLDEHTIRRALRLDAEEIPARLDPAIVAAAARASRSRTSTGIALAAAAAFVGGWVWSEVFRALVGTVLASAGIDPVALAVDVADAVALRIAPIAQAASMPVIPIAIFVAAVIAALFEQMKGRTHATPS